QVLTKIIGNKRVQIDDKNIISSGFPNIDISNFYYEIISSEDTNLISICRKSHVDEIIQRYISNKLNVIDFSLGNSKISSAIEFIEEPNFYTSNAMIELSNQTISSIKIIND
ncbi:hypothetical protein H4O21_24910, partial [Oceanospirillum sp. D5]|nr:hypothetical protein [Oceanospirillum sediminis]